MSDVKELEPKDKEKYKKGFFSRLFGSKDDGKDGKKSAEAVRLQYPVLCACWSLDTRWVALGDVAGNVVLYSADIVERKVSMVPKCVLPSAVKGPNSLAANPVECAAFSNDNIHLATVSVGAPVQILNVLTGQSRYLEKVDSPITCVAWSCDGDYLAMGTKDGTIDIHSVRKDFQVVETLPAHIDGVHSLEWCPVTMKRHLLASGGMNPEDAVKIWDTSTFNGGAGASTCCFAAKLSAFWKKDKAFVLTRWTYDGRYLLCGDFAGMITIFDVIQRSYIGVLEGHCLRLRSITTSPDLRYVATASEDQMIKIWELSSRRCVLTHLSQSNNVVVIWVPSMHCESAILVSEGEFLGVLYPKLEGLADTSAAAAAAAAGLGLNEDYNRRYTNPEDELMNSGASSAARPGRSAVKPASRPGEMYVGRNDFSEPLIDPRTAAAGHVGTDSHLRVPSGSAAPYAQPSPSVHNKSPRDEEVKVADGAEYKQPDSRIRLTKSSSNISIVPLPAEVPSVSKDAAGDNNVGCDFFIGRRYALCDTPISNFPQFEHLVQLFKGKTRELLQYEESVKRGKEAFLGLNDNAFEKLLGTAAPVAPPLHADLQIPRSPSRDSVEHEDAEGFIAGRPEHSGAQAAVASPLPEPGAGAGKSAFVTSLKQELRRLEQKVTPMAKLMESQVRTNVARARWKLHFWQKSKLADAEKAHFYQEMLEDLDKNAKVVETYYTLCNSIVHVWPPNTPPFAFDKPCEKELAIQQQLWKLTVEEQCAHFIAAAKQNDKSTVDACVAMGIEVNVRETANSFTSLMFAASLGHLDIAIALLISGAKVNLQNSTGDTALILAAEGLHTDVVQALLDKGADMNVRNSKHQCALDLLPSAAAAQARSPQAALEAELIRKLLADTQPLAVVPNPAVSSSESSPSRLSTAKALDPAEKHKESLESLHAMGFMDDNYNLQLLVAYDGDFRKTLNQLVSDPSPHPVQAHPAVVPAPNPIPKPPVSGPPANAAGMAQKRGSSNPPPPPATPVVFEEARVMYEPQLSQLVDMGFKEETTNTLALIATGGNVQNALERFLMCGVKPPSVPGLDARHPFFGLYHAADKQPAQSLSSSPVPHPPPSSVPAKAAVDASAGASSRPPPCVPGAKPLSDELMSAAVMQALSIATESKPQSHTASVNSALDPLAPKPQASVSSSASSSALSLDRVPPGPPISKAAQQYLQQQQEQEQARKLEEEKKRQSQALASPSPASVPLIAAASASMTASAEAAAPPTSSPATIDLLLQMIVQLQAQQPQSGQASQSQMVQSLLMQVQQLQQQQQQQLANSPLVPTPSQSPPPPQPQLAPFVMQRTQPLSQPFVFPPERDQSPVSSPVASLPPTPLSTPPPQAQPLATVPAVSPTSSIQSQKQLTPTMQPLEPIKAPSAGPFVESSGVPLKLTEQTVITDPGYYQSQWASLPVEQSVEWELKYSCPDDARAASCKTEPIETLLAKHFFFTMASGNVNGQLKFYLSAYGTVEAPPPDPSDPVAMFLAATNNAPPSAELFLIEVLIVLKTGHITTLLKCSSESGREAILRELRTALAPLLK